MFDVQQIYLIYRVLSDCFVEKDFAFKNHEEMFALVKSNLHSLIIVQQECQLGLPFECKVKLKCSQFLEIGFSEKETCKSAINKSTFELVAPQAFHL